MQTCDVAVIGLGAMGLSALLHLRRGRVDAIGFERVYPGHPAGSSHGESRVFRLVNFENPAYGPLGQRALAQWRGLEEYPGELYENCGVLEAGPADCDLILGTRQAAAEAEAGADAGIEAMTGAEANLRFPALSVPPEWEANHHRIGGFLRPDRILARQLDLVRGLGSDPVQPIGVRSVRQRGDSVEVTTEGGEVISAGAAIVAAGPWLRELVDLPLPLSLSRQVLGWFEPSAPADVSVGKLPVFMLQTVRGLIYGFPDVDGRVKAASHEAGDPVSDPGSVAAGREADLGPVISALEQYLPAAIRPGAPIASKTCLYTNTSDEEFILDRHPDQPNIILASACSGHGFKFATAIGEILSDLAQKRAPVLDIGPYRLGRLAHR